MGISDKGMMSVIKKSTQNTKLKRVFNNDNIQVGDLVKIHKLFVVSGLFGSDTSGDELDVHQEYLKGVVEFASPDSFKLITRLPEDDESSTVRITIEEVLTNDTAEWLSKADSFDDFSGLVLPVVKAQGYLYVVEVV